MLNNIHIIKANGQKELFNENKLHRSLERASVPKTLHDTAISHIKQNLHENITSKEIYNQVLEYLGSSTHPFTASKYSLKKAIMDLGPTGFPFEKFIAAILRNHGYEIKTDIILRGLCVAHEVDVIAQNSQSNIMIECKFHNNVGNRTDVKVALYVMARYQDITAGMINRQNSIKFNEVWLVTNTKCSEEAILYAQCMGMKIISWGYPEKGNLQDLIEKEKLHPITCLSTINTNQKKILLDNNIILARDLAQNNMFIELLRLSTDQKNSLLHEIEDL